MKNIIFWLLSFIFVSAIGHSGIASATLIGDPYTARIVINNINSDFLFSSVDDIARQGPDDIGNWRDALAYDVEDSTITVSSLSNRGPWNPLTFEFLDLNWIDYPLGGIIGASVTSATGEGWVLIEDSDLSFTDTSLIIDAAIIEDFDSSLDQSLTVTLLTTHDIPEPTTLALMGLGIAGLGFGRRAA